MFVIINPLLVLLMIHPSLTLSSSSLPNPHGPQKLTWEVVSPSGSVAWSTSDTRVPGTWWPSLHPDVCQIVLGLDTWDLPNQDAVPHPSTVPEPFLYPPGSTTTMGAGCRYRVRRCRLRQLEFYVCPKDGRRQDQIFRCGGPESLYCKAWGCETTGAAHWGPSSGIGLLYSITSLLRTQVSVHSSSQGVGGPLPHVQAPLRAIPLILPLPPQESNTQHCPVG